MIISSLRNPIALPDPARTPTLQPAGDRAAAYRPTAGTPFRILVVDDDEVSRASIERSLSATDVELRHALDGASAAVLLGSWVPDLIILEIELPAVDGLNVLIHLRRFTDARVMVLSRRCEEPDRVLGFELGADDYLAKPCSVGELNARVRSIIRRHVPASAVPERSTRICIDGLMIDRSSREVIVGDTVVPLTAKEFELLAFLAGSPRQVFSREQLLESVWKSSSGWQDPGTVTEHVRRLRRNLEMAGGNRQWIRTVRGNGYAFHPERSVAPGNHVRVTQDEPTPEIVDLTAFQPIG